MTEEPHNPTTLSEEKQRRFDRHVSQLFDHLLDQVKYLLEDIDSLELREQTYRLAFKPNDILPKRLTRPQILIAHLSDQVYLALADDDSHRDTILQFAILVQEYYDMLDDLVDGDVAPGHEADVVGVSQLLMPIVVRRLNRIGPRAIDYWTSRAMEMIESLYLETSKEKSLEHYLEALDKQSFFFGYATGVAAIAAGADDDALQRAEEIGRYGYRYGQFALDLFQEGEELGDNWNATHFLSREEILEYMAEWRDELDARLEPYPDEHAELVRAMFSTDLTRWRQLG
jgi:hypothetical protein